MSTAGDRSGDGCTLVTQYCDVTESAVLTVAAGTTTWVQSNHQCQNCTSACGTEENQPPETNCAATVTVSYTNSVTHSMTGTVTAKEKKGKKGTGPFNTAQMDLSPFFLSAAPAVLSSLSSKPGNS
jgi:hypothetical protein